MADYIMTLRDVPGSAVAPTASHTTFLKLDDADPDLVNPARAMAIDVWVADIIDQVPKQTDATGVVGQVFLDQPVALKHQIGSIDGFLGTVISFDWPSGDVALAYLPDRQEAKETAFALVRDGIWPVAQGQSANCDINVHLLAHSTGAYVVQEAFDDADDHAAIASVNWTVSQIAFISGDISFNSMEAGDSETESIYRHCLRLTNYSNTHDEVLQISNVKRIGVEPRVGRIGLPDLAPPQALNVDCSAYYQASVAGTMGVVDSISGSHSWQLTNMVFACDLAQTLN